MLTEIVAHSVFGEFLGKLCFFPAGGILEGVLEKWRFYLGFEGSVGGHPSLLRISWSAMCNRPI